jgi:hypothetical protein
VIRGLGVFITTVTALSLVASAQAAPRHDRAASGQVGARIALERALGYFAPGEARRSFRRAAKSDPRGATMALRDLAAVFERLSGRDRRLAAEILARPTDGGAGNYSAPRGDFRRVCPPNFCVHWVTSTQDRPSLTDASPANGIPDWIDNVKAVMSEVWTTEITNLGYRKPKADKPTGGHRGGNPNTKLDIFIQNIGRDRIYGYCTTDDPRRSKRRDVSAYCVLDDDYSSNQFPAPSANGIDALKVTAAHEFHHASQFAYDWKEDRALMEGTAVNMEADVYPTIPDNFQYFPASPLRPDNDSSRTSTSDGPWWPIDMFDAQFGNQYGSWIFYRFLEEYFGSPTHPDPDRDPTINRQIWQQAAAVQATNNGGKYSTQAIRAAIAARGDTFDDVFAEFGWANASPANWYTDGALYPTAGYVDRGLFGNTGSDSANRPMFHFSNDYFLFRPNPTASTIDFTFNFPDTVRGSNATVLTLNSDGSVSHTAVALDSSGNGSLDGVGFDDAVVDGVVLVLTNSSVRMTNCGSHSFSEPVTFACRGDARDDFFPNGFNWSIDVN